MNRKLLYRKLFKSQSAKQKQYEVLRALAAPDNMGKPLAAIAEEFHYKAQTLRNLYNLVIQDKVSFFIEEHTGPKQPRIKPDAIKRIIQMRKEAL